MSQKGNTEFSTWNLEKNNDKAINPEKWGCGVDMQGNTVVSAKLAKLEKSINELNNQMIEVLDEEHISN